MDQCTPNSTGDVILSFILFGVLVRGFLVPWLSKTIVGIIKLIFLRSEREYQLWHEHYSKARSK